MEIVKFNDQIICIIIRNDYSSQGVEFFTPENFSQQMAYMSHPPKKLIEPHVHKKNTRSIFFTQEVLFIKRGKIRVDIYNDEKKYIKSRILCKGDVILLASGGHGFEVLEELEMIEVKQGPYSREEDKIRFKAITPDKIKLT